MKHVAVAAGIVIALAGCGSMAAGPEGTSATAEMKNASGQTVGTARLDQVSGGVRVVLEMQGLPPGDKGVHIHAVGKCDPPDFASAAAHFNPTGKKHGLENPEGPHAGDLPNITVAANGAGRLETTTNRVTLGAGETSLFDADGSSVIVHAGQDDMKTDPTGNSGGRIACGVITNRGAAAKSSSGY